MDQFVCIRFCLDTKGGITDAAVAVKDPRVLIKSMKVTLEFESFLVERFSPVNPNSGMKETQGFAIPDAFNAMSSAFEPHMIVYVEAEEKRLAENLTRLIGMGLKPDEGNVSVLANSTELFLIYKELLVQFSKLSRGKLMVDLTQMFCRYLEKYNEFLESHVKDEKRSGLNAEDWTGLCTVLNTAYYCSTIAFQVCLR
jgi:hypothetical protein